MKNILVIGATGQIGSELTLELRKRYGDDHVVAGYIPSAMPKGELKASGPSAIADVTDRQSIEVVARQFKIDTIYNLAAIAFFIPITVAMPSPIFSTMPTSSRSTSTV